MNDVTIAAVTCGLLILLEEISFAMTVELASVDLKFLQPKSEAGMMFFLWIWKWWRRMARKLSGWKAQVQRSCAEAAQEGDAVNRTNGKNILRNCCLPGHCTNATFEKEMKSSYSSLQSNLPVCTKCGYHFLPKKQWNKDGQSPLVGSCRAKSTSELSSLIATL